jgi:CHAT domain-containing protein
VPDERASTDSDVPLDVAAGAQHFGIEFRKFFGGKSLTTAAWNEHAPSARYIFLSSIPTAFGDGFEFADGVLSLDDVRTTKLNSELVILTATGEYDQQVRRVRALMDAGARMVLVQGWEVPSDKQQQFIVGFFASLNRERPMIRAFGEARNSMLLDVESGQRRDDAGEWGAMVLFGVP